LLPEGTAALEVHLRTPPVQHSRVFRLGLDFDRPRRRGEGRQLDPRRPGEVAHGLAEVALEAVDERRRPVVDGLQVVRGSRVFARVGVPRLQGHGLREVGQAALEIALLGAGDAPGEEGAGLVRGRVDRLGVVGDGFVVVPPKEMRVASSVPRRRLIRLEAQGRAEVGDGLLLMPLVPERLAARGVGREVARLVANGLGKVGDGPGPVAEACGGFAPAHEGGHIGRVQLQNLREVGASLRPLRHHSVSRGAECVGAD
jgi:hypothetical protein